MSTPISIASPPRLLRPVSGKILNDGAAFVPLSPHKGVRNAVIIYEAIKNLPDQTLIRGDFDKESQPLIYFPERPPKQVGNVAVDAVADGNARCDRAEFASFMKSIVEATFKAAPTHAPELRAAFELRCRTLKITGSGCDFTVGDIRESLRSIAKSYYRRQLKQITSPHRTKQGDDSLLQIKRFKQFESINDTLLVQLCTALSAGIGDGKKAESKALAAINSMKKMIFEYRVLRNTENMSFSDFLLKHPIAHGVHSFAKLWLVLNGPDRNDRTQFCTESWALEMDLICPMIVNAYRAAKQLKNQRISEETSAPLEKSPEVSNKAPDTPQKTETTVSPSDSPTKTPKVRTLRRRFSRQVMPLPSVKPGAAEVLSPTLKRQSSVPQLTSRTARKVVPSMERRDSLDLWIDPPSFRPVVTYSANNTSTTASELQAPLSAVSNE